MLVIRQSQLFRDSNETHEGRDTMAELMPPKQFELRYPSGVIEQLTMKMVRERWTKHWTFRAYAKVGDKLEVAQGVLIRTR